MGLTRIRAQQISDIDYKQAVRVITLTNITLAGGAPVEVDGVTLLAGDRILVNGQSNAAQNGLYVVQTLGTGANGTWVRTTDGNEDGEIQPGMVVMVTQGDEYADTPWKLITNGTIIIGTTELVFEENYSLAFGNVFANGTAVVANTVSAPLTLTAGDNISIVGNNTSKSITIGVTGITVPSRLANGTSDIDIAVADGNVVTTVDSNVILTVTSTGANIAGYVDVTGNTVTGNILTDGYFYANGAPFEPGGTPGGANTSIQFNDDDVFGGTAGFTFDKATNAVSTTGTITATGNVTGGNLTTAGGVDATGNIAGGNILGNGAGLSGINVFSNISVLGGSSVVADSISDTLTLVAGDGITIIANATADTITFSTAGSGSIFDTGGQMGLITESPTSSEDLGLVTDAVIESYELGSMGVDGIVTNQNIVNGSLTGNKFAPDTDLATTGNLSVGNLTVTGALEFDTISANNAIISDAITGNTIVGNSIAGDTITGDTITGNNITSSTGNIDISANLVPSANVIYNLGNTTNRWNELYLAGNSIYLGNIIIKNTEGNTVEFFDADGTTPATISDQNIDTTTISNGSTSMGIPEEGGNIVANVDGTVVTTIQSTGLTVNGDTSSNFFVSPRTITANTTVGNINAMSSGPITIADGVTVTVSSGGDWSIL
jgi:hypothetical protein